MYICSRCGAPSKPGEPLLKITRYKQDGNIQREEPVCKACMENPNREVKTSTNGPQQPTGVYKTLRSFNFDRSRNERER